MSTAGNSKKDRRDHAREVAREMREAERKRRLRNRLFIQGGVGVAIIAIVVVIVLVVISVNKPAGPGPQNMASDGILFQQSGTDAAYVPTGNIAVSATPTPNPVDNADGKTHLIEFIDWTCPVCKQFETTYSDTLLSMVKSGTATIEFRPVAILDRVWGGDRYSSRAANAAACMANYDPNNYLAAQSTFYANQPAEETATGLKNSEMEKLLTDVGVDIDAKHDDGLSIKDCIEQETFKAWVKDATLRAGTEAADPSTGSFGTPTVMINGVRWSPSQDGPDFVTAFNDNKGADTAALPTS